MYPYYGGRRPQRYPRGVSNTQRLSQREKRWRRAWPFTITLVSANLMLFLTLIIFGLEVASLASDNSTKLSNTASTGAGIWCSISFLITVIFMYHLVLVCDSSQRWATYTLISNMITLVFICVLISLDANTITPYNTTLNPTSTKIQLLRGQLVGAVLMLTFPISYLAMYIYTAFKSVTPPRSQRSSVRVPVPFPTRLRKY